MSSLVSREEKKAATRRVRPRSEHRRDATDDEQSVRCTHSAGPHTACFAQRALATVAPLPIEYSAQRQRACRRPRGEKDAYSPLLSFGPSSPAAAITRCSRQTYGRVDGRHSRHALPSQHAARAKEYAQAARNRLDASRYSRALLTGPRWRVSMWQNAVAQQL